MHIVRVMSLLMIPTDLHDHPHVSIVLASQLLPTQLRVFYRLQKNISDFLATLRQLNQKLRIQTIFFLNLLPRSTQTTHLHTLHKYCHFRKSCFAFFEYGQKKFFIASGVFLHGNDYNRQVQANNINKKHDHFANTNIFIIMLKEQPTNEDGQFQAIGNIPLFQIVSASVNMQKHTKEPQIENQQQQVFLNWRHKLQLNQGNPILPPGRYHMPQQPRSTLLRFTGFRQKFNRTSFVASSMQKELIKSVSEQADNKQSKQLEKTEKQAEIDQQFNALMKQRNLVYRRLNNSKINQLNKNRVLCSIFFDWRRQKVNSKNQPVYQWLKKKKKLQISGIQQNWLQFDSAFQSGNLLMALRDTNATLPVFELYMQNDVNTKGCTQWYFFRVFNKLRGKAKIRLMNFYKPTSLYQKGMKVLCCNQGGQWRRTGTSITYSVTQSVGHYSLDFIHEFDTANKTTYFSYGYPYTYSNHLTNFLNSISGDPKFSKILKKTTICLSAAGNPIPYLTISNLLIKDPKPIIFIIARQHPGQTPASFIVQGLINYLLSFNLQAKQLRQRFQFRIVPMVNVDGVISGNYRSNLSGSDINRQWMFPSKRAHPEVIAIKNQIGANRKQVALFLDIHAHSRKMNSFFYGSKPTQTDKKLYPFICSKLNKFISYAQSSFADDPSKKTTARVILQTEFNIQQSLTFEVSFYGWKDPIKQTNHSFRQQDYRSIGQSLATGFYYSLIGINKAKNAINQPAKFYNQKQAKIFKNSQKLLQKWIKQTQTQQQDQIVSQGSSLDPQHFQLKQDQKLFIQQQFKQQYMLENVQVKRTASTPKQPSHTIDINNESKYSTFTPSNQSKLLTPKGKKDSSRILGIAPYQVCHITNKRAKGRQSKRQAVSVRQLQLQLQVQTQRPSLRALRGLRHRMGNTNTNLQHYESLDIDRSKNYKQQVLQMKKALKYLLETKTADLDHYKSCFKSQLREMGRIQKEKHQANKIEKHQARFSK